MWMTIDINFFAEAPTFNESYAKLNDMMMHDGGGQDRSRDHNSRFEMLKLTLVGFSHRHMQDPAQPGKLIAEPWPSFLPGDTTIKPTKAHKFVGVALTRSLGGEHRWSGLLPRPPSGPWLPTAWPGQPWVSPPTRCISFIRWWPCRVLHMPWTFGSCRFAGLQEMRSSKAL